MQLYKLSEQYRRLFDMLGQDEAEDEAVLTTIEGLDEEIEAKLQNIAHGIKNLGALESAMAEAIKEMRDRKGIVERQIERLKKYAKVHMEINGFNNVKWATGSIALRIGAGRVDYLDGDETHVPDKYIKQVVSIKTDKAAINADLKAGIEVENCVLVKDVSVIVK